MSTYSAVVGVLLMSLSGLTVTGELVLSKIMKELDLPYWHIMAFCCAIACCLVLMGLAALKVAMPPRAHMTWLVLKGFCGGGYWALGVVAVQVGASPGDAAALMSINIVVAAFLGRTCLGEKLRFLHVGAVMCSTAGALLIAQPSFLFGGEGDSSSWGHFFAALAGFTQSCAFICSRKAAAVHVGFHTLSTFVFSTAIAAALPVTSVVREAPLGILWTSPLASTAWVTGSFALTLTAVVVACAGAILCPVAVSATVYTATTMLFGYTAQILVFGSTPSTTTLVGAALMFAAVVLMALVRAPAQAGEQEAPTSELAKEASKEEAATPSTNSPQSSAAGSIDDTDESLACFIASEVSAFSPGGAARPRSQSMRMRKIFSGGMVSANSVPAQQIGEAAVAPTATV